jgi:hypothetical protein
MLKRYHTIADLPAVIPVFPLTGSLLLPRADLPLNIFEPRYLQMFSDAMAGEKIIGMIQPKAETDEKLPALSHIGCAGRITSYSETQDGRLLISLTGVCRFAVQRELPSTMAYRQVEAAYWDFAGDLVADDGNRSVNRDAVVRAFRQYLEANNMTANWDEVERVPVEALVNSLSQLAPYPALEKQALLEAPDLKTRAEMLIALTELALEKSGAGPKRPLQ